MADAAWKRLERELGKRDGSGRTPLSGGNSKHTRADTLSDVFFNEAKYTSDKRSPFYPIWRECSKMKGGGFRIRFRGMDMTVFRTSKKELNIEEVDIEDHKRWKLWSVWGFFMNTIIPRAKAERKIPVLSIKFKGQRGEVMLCRTTDFPRVRDTYWWYSTKQTRGDSSNGESRKG